MGKNHSCKYFRLQMDEYIEGELSEAEMREFEAHIAECEECRRELESMRALNAIMRSNREKTPEGLHARIMTAVRSEPSRKPRRTAAFFRSASVFAACIALCLCITAIFTMMPLWQENTGGGLPDDPMFASTEDGAEKVETLPSLPTDSEAEVTEIPEDVTPEPEEITSALEMTDEAIVTEAIESVEGELTFVVAESAAPPAETEAPEMTAVPEMTAAPESMTEPETMEKPETDAPSEAETTEKHYFKGDTVTVPTYDASSEKLSAPGGEEITMALLVVSGLLAVASFIAFLISLSSVRTGAHKKDGEEK